MNHGDDKEDDWNEIQPASSSRTALFFHTSPASRVSARSIRTVQHRFRSASPSRKNDSRTRYPQNEREIAGRPELIDLISDDEDQSPPAGLSTRSTSRSLTRSTSLRLKNKRLRRMAEDSEESDSENESICIKRRKPMKAKDLPEISFDNFNDDDSAIHDSALPPVRRSLLSKFGKDDDENDEDQENDSLDLDLDNLLEEQSAHLSQSFRTQIPDIFRPSSRARERKQREDMNSP
ncbi:hypothetical protein FGB62_339g06 [Gracilaria domingensis]|nr:hypothetical protein FGB62_339g06 [Gracilaria domingensis]